MVTLQLTPGRHGRYHAVTNFPTEDFTLTATKQLIRVGHSPDPDDAFMFYALANDRIDTGDYEFQHELVDIETLNRRAFKASWSSPPSAFTPTLSCTTNTFCAPAAPAWATATGRWSWPRSR